MIFASVESDFELRYRKIFTNISPFQNYDLCRWILKDIPMGYYSNENLNAKTIKDFTDKKNQWFYKDFFFFLFEVSRACKLIFYQKHCWRIVNLAVWKCEKSIDNFFFYTKRLYENASHFDGNRKNPGIFRTIFRFM